MLDSINDSMLNYETSHSNENRFLGDVNGDGKDDLIIQYANSSGKRTFDVFAGNYNGQFEASVTTITNNSHNTITYPCSMYVSDINHDGRKDYIVKWKNGNYFTVYVYKGKVNYQFETCVSTNSSSKFYLG